MAIDQKKFEQNNQTIALSTLFVPHNTETIRLAYKSKYNQKRENQVILLLITDVEKCHDLVVKRLSGLLCRITSNHIGDCMVFLHSFRTDNAFKKHERLCGNHD